MPKKSHIRTASEVICFSNLRLQKAGLLKCMKGRVSEQLWTVNILKNPKRCINLHCSIFVMFLDRFDRNALF